MGVQAAEGSHALPAQETPTMTTQARTGDDARDDDRARIPWNELPIVHDATEAEDKGAPCVRAHGIEVYLGRELVGGDPLLAVRVLGAKGENYLAMGHNPMPDLTNTLEARSALRGAMQDAGVDVDGTPLVESVGTDLAYLARDLVATQESDALSLDDVEDRDRTED